MHVTLGLAETLGGYLHDRHINDLGGSCQVEQALQHDAGVCHSDLLGLQFRLARLTFVTGMGAYNQFPKHLSDLPKTGVHWQPFPKRICELLRDGAFVQVFPFGTPADCKL